ncbi:OLC1v1015074C1 [Oldenlandia corymbosa var. corymbosa]|uniref:ATP-dependent RNA helicase n=1 Tax=Oldenlandia corymbosa var. corymbosa TaxID=529605 RepID=A0AAV1E2D4_OLDCO|nr:OLC1v1015074C1 [Oldenlandia corymbosa var. corymbosa]
MFGYQVVRLDEKTLLRTLGNSNFIVLYGAVVYDLGWKPKVSVMSDRFKIDPCEVKSRIKETLEGDDFTSYDEVHKTFDAMGLQENLVKGIMNPFAIQQRGVVPFCRGLDVIQLAQSGTGKTAAFCLGILQRLDYALIQCQACRMD